MNKRVIKVIFFLLAIILGILLGTGIISPEKIGGPHQDGSDPVPRPPVR